MSGDATEGEDFVMHISGNLATALQVLRMNAVLLPDNVGESLTYINRIASYSASWESVVVSFAEVQAVKSLRTAIKESASREAKFLCWCWFPPIILRFGLIAPQ